jgi:nicotinate phosphoribosyltransferase
MAARSDPRNGLPPETLEDGESRLAHGPRDAVAAASSRRLPPEIFDLPVARIRAGHYTDAYFNHAREVLLRDGRHPRVVMQVFQRKHAILAGIDEALAVLELCSDDREELSVHALADGDEARPYETVMTIEGDYTAFAHLETVYLGCLARRTLVATNVRRVVEAANGKRILYFPARHDHFFVQPGDGYAARLGGATAVSTDAQASWWGGEGVGTVPHALIAAYGGNTVVAASKFAEHAGRDLELVVLVDFENDSVRTSLEVARALGDRLWGVRLDTSRTLVDRALWSEMGYFDPRGVNGRLVERVRTALDAEGFERVRIVVSGGFDAERIRAFEETGVPVDAYGVGSSLIRGENDFTADVVVTDGVPSAKVGRRFVPNERLELVAWRGASPSGDVPL